MGLDRVQRILARAGIASRREAKVLLQEGRVTVNGHVAESGSRADPARDSIKVDGRRVKPHSGPHRYLLLNKPRAVLSTVSDPQGRRTVMDLVPRRLRKALVPVGRLDYNTEGLILLTDDGDLAQRVAHPRFGGIKTYEVKVKGNPNGPALDQLRRGIWIRGRKTAPANIVARPGQKPTGRKPIERGGARNSWWIIELTEGRTRQIREMFFRIGHPVQRLRRVAIGPLRDPNLSRGAIRELSEREVESLRRATARAKNLQPSSKLAKKKPRRGQRSSKA